METWTPREIATKADWEGGWWSFYMWGGLTQRTDDQEINNLLLQLRDAFERAEGYVSRLEVLLPEPSTDSD